MKPAAKLFQMAMKTDIASREDIDALMAAFYSRAMADPVIGYLFTDVAELDLEHHLPVIGDFWESTLFGAGNYSRHGRNPLLIHAALDRKSPLNDTISSAG
jgi:hemoglobin